jgi:hypothetical protein
MRLLPILKTGRSEQERDKENTGSGEMAGACLLFHLSITLFDTLTRTDTARRSLIVSCPLQLFVYVL